MPRLPDLLVEIASRHAVYLEGNKTQFANQFETFLTDMEKDILGRLRRIDNLDGLRGKKLNAMLKAVRKTLNGGFLDYEKVWREQLKELADYESGFTLRSLGQVVRADFTLPTPTLIMTAAFANPLSVQGVDGGALLDTFFRDWTDKTTKRVEGAIRLAVAQGQSATDLVRRIRGTAARRFKDGIVDATRRDINLMARTSYQHIANQTRSAVYAANSDIIVREEYTAVLDSRTTPLCRGLDGTRYKVGKGPMPPLHMACRSIRVPVLKDGLNFLEDAGTQFSRGADGVKFVSASKDYYGWLKTQPKGFQDSVLGIKRGQLLRTGGLTAERFRELQLDKNFKERTLEEIRALEPEAFANAGL